MTPIPTRLPRETPVGLPDNELAQRVDDYLTRRADDQDFSGAALVARNGTILLKKAFGQADTKNNLPNTVDTRFQIASVSKTLTATAIMLLVERGTLNLQAPISAYLPNLPSAWSRVTVEQLLAHTSGIPDYLTFDEFADRLNLTPDEVIRVAASYPLDFEPGREYEYSNTGYVLLGKIIETVSGQTYGDFLRQTIFDPLQMSATGREQNNTPLALGYISFDQPARTYPITNRLGDGDLLSTVDDLYKFDRALYGEALLPRTAREKMFTPVGTNNYGYGWEIQAWNGKRVVSHTGGINGFASLLMRFPDDDATIILLSNIESFDAAQAAYEIADMLWQ